MAYKIMRANTPDLIEQVFKLRHQVFVEQEGILKATADGRLIDRFDAYPTSNSFVVVSEDKVVGALRLALDSTEGVPADEYYDFRKHVPENSCILHVGLFCVSEPYRGVGLTMGLMMMSTYFAASNGVTHVFAPINPPIVRLAERVGFKVIGEEFIDAHTGAAMMPLLLDMNQVNDFFLRYIKNNQLQDFLQDYENWYFKAGEEIIRAGTTGKEAFLIIEGTVQVKLAGTDQVLSELGQGEVFGELALLTDEPRSADVVAKTNIQVMVLPKAAFHNRFLNHPEQGLKLLGMMGKRTQSLIHQLEESINNESL